jgi:hypothetical protein
MPKPDREALRMMKSVALMLGVWGVFHSLSRGDSWALTWLGSGTLVAVSCGLLPRMVLPLARPLYRVVLAVGDVVSSVVLSGIYLLVVWPWHGVLRLAGRLEAPEEPWPPRGESAWRPVEYSNRVARRARPGSWLAVFLTQAGAAVALLRFVYARPFAFIVPVLLLMLLFAALILLGHSTALGPLVYTLF